MKPTNQRISDGWYHIDQQRKKERARLRSGIARPQPVRRGGCFGALLLAIVRLLVLIFVLAVACGLVVVIAAYAL
jgi:hypothetical protein